MPSNMQMLERHLSDHHKGEWLAGPEFTAADIMMSYTLGLLRFTSQSPAEVPVILTADMYPVATAYLNRLHVWHMILLVATAAALRQCALCMTCMLSIPHATNTCLPPGGSSKPL